MDQILWHEKANRNPPNDSNTRFFPIRFASKSGSQREYQGGYPDASPKRLKDA